MRHSKLFLLLPFVFASNANAGMDDFISQQVTNQVARSTSSAISKSLNDNLIIPQLNIRNASGLVNDFSFSGDEQLFAVLHQDKTVRVWDTQLGVQRPTIYAPNATKVEPLSKTNSVLIATTTGIISRYDALTGTVLNQMNSGNDAIVAMTISEDETLLLTAHQNGKIVAWDLNAFGKIKEFATDYSDKIKNLVLNSNKQTVSVTTEEGHVDIWQISDGKKIAEQSQLSEPLLAIGQNNNLQIVIDKDSVLQQFDISTASQISNKKLNDDSILAAAISNKADKIAISTENKTLKLFQNSGALLKEIPVTEDMMKLTFLNDGQQLLASDQKGIIHLWQTSTGMELLKLIATTTGWTVVDDKGRFDGSEAGMPNVSWDAASVNLPLDNFSEHYYEPGLLATHLARKPAFINAQPRQIQAGINLPPEMTMNFPQATRQAGQNFTVTVQLTDAGGGLGEQKLYHNGKIVDAKAIRDSKEIEVNSKLTRTVSYNVKPLAGVNTFKAISTNKMGIENAPVMQTVDFSGAANQNVLHIITVGINQYKDSQLNLNFSVADAKAIEDTIHERQLPFFSKIEEQRLLDQNATKAAILNALKNAEMYGQNDVLALYFAGHGLAINGEWYFMPHETTLQTDENAYAQIGISAKEIQDLLINIPAQKIIVMIDSCYSGASLDTFRQLQNTQRHFGRKVSKSVGTVFLAATRKDQEAAELNDLGHGLFTYVVTSGMKGEADISPVDTHINAHELAEFSTAKIPTFSRKYLAASQEPTAFTIGEDFRLIGK